jgi:hypothetical protein
MDSMDSDIVKFAKWGRDGGEIARRGRFVAGLSPLTMERSRATFQAAFLVGRVTQA